MQIKRALFIFHAVNIFHILFYGYLMLMFFNTSNLRSIVAGNNKIILILYLALVLGLNFYAKHIGGIQNPMRTVK